MPVKRRTAKARNPLITAEVIALFKRGLELQAIGVDEIDFDGDFSIEHSAERNEYIQLTKRLHWTLLRLDPGDCGPLDVWPGIEPYGAELHRASIAPALELRRLLMKEIRR